MKTINFTKLNFALLLLCLGLLFIIAAGVYEVLGGSQNHSQNLNASTGANSNSISNSTPAPTSIPIKHVIVIFQENTAFDTYFGTYPGADGIPNDTCIPVNVTQYNSTCVKPFLLNKSQAITLDFPHSYPDEVVDIDGGKMDGFITAALGCNQTVGYYDNSTIPYYWDYANHFVLSDHTFQSFVGWSSPNHWALVAALTPITGFYQPTNKTPPYKVRLSYVHEASSIPTLADMMSKSNISWKYYDKQIPIGMFGNALKNGSVIDFWNPFEAINTSYTQKLSSHFVLRGTIFSDINSSSLPNVSWVIPSAPISEHSPANITWGMWWTASIVDAVGKSRYWNNTVIIVTWDDFGGWYDHVIPPNINSSTSIDGTVAEGAGLRVPLIIISPYAKPGYVDHTQFTFSSIMKLIETTFKLQSLNVRDKTTNDMLDAFNFSQNPLPPVIEPLNATQSAVVNQWAFTPTGSVVPAPAFTQRCAILAFHNLNSSRNNVTYRGFINGNPD